MSFSRPSNWNYNSRSRGGRGRGRGGFDHGRAGFDRGRGGFDRGRGGFDRGRGGPRSNPWGRNNFRGPPQFANAPYWGDWNQDYSGPANRHINQQWQNRSKRDAPDKRLSEVDIGVTEFVSDHEGFTGVIKSRYSDFQVAEINDNGEVAKLTDVNPPIPVDETVDEDEDLLLTKYNVEILPMDTWDSINKLVVAKGEPTDKVEIDVTGMSKEQRTKIHDAVKKAFGDSIVGSTVNEDDKKIVRFVRYRKGVRIDNRVKWTWPGEYVYFIVHKENCDTMDAAAYIAEKLRMNMKPSMLGYSGTKDRRAKTSQWFSIRKVDPRRLHAALGHARRLRIGNFSFHARPLRLGMLQGNRFRIVLRNVTASEQTVQEACALVAARGFINYYGLQRFGTRRDLPTHVVGARLLQSNFRKAIDCILASSGDRRVQNEGKIRQALARAPNDLLGALQKVPRNARLLYLHSYQSLIWNRAVTERIKRFGLQPAVGDLVPLAEVDKEEVDEDDSDDEEQSNGKEEENKPDREAKTELEEAEKQTEKKIQSNDEPKPKLPVKILTQEDIDSGSYTIFDIIMPLPGYNIDYPPNIKDYYEELLTTDGLTLDLKHKIKRYSMSGAYRHVAARPRDMCWRVVRYSDPHADLLLSDADELDGRVLTADLPDGKYRALILEMSLPASCYATMALRELLKVDTAGDNQALQNNYHKRKREDSKGEDESDTTDKNGEEKSKQEEEQKEMAVDESPNEHETLNSVKTECTDAKKAKTVDSGQ